jgi:hypothetical protein
MPIAVAAPSLFSNSETNRVQPETVEKVDVAVVTLEPGKAFVLAENAIIVAFDGGVKLAVVEEVANVVLVPLSIFTGVPVINRP